MQQKTKSNTKTQTLIPMKSGLVILSFCLVMNVADGAIGQFLMQRHSGLAAFLTRNPNSPLVLSQQMTSEHTLTRPDVQSSTVLCFCHPADCRSSCCRKWTSSSSELVLRADCESFSRRQKSLELLTQGGKMTSSGRPKSNWCGDVRGAGVAGEVPQNF